MIQLWVETVLIHWLWTLDWPLRYLSRSDEADGLDNEGICYWYSIIPSRLKCYGEISWSVPRLSFSLITAWPLPSLYGYLKWENITSMTGYKDTRLWYHDKKIVSQSSNWTGSHNLSARFQKTWEWISNNQPSWSCFKHNLSCSSLSDSASSSSDKLQLKTEPNKTQQQSAVAHCAQTTLAWQQPLLSQQWWSRLIRAPLWGLNPFAVPHHNQSSAMNETYFTKALHTDCRVQITLVLVTSRRSLGPRKNIQ